MYIKRKIDDLLISWKSSTDKKPMIIKGARQVGKTETVRHFASSYKNFIEINFVEEPKYTTITSDGYSVDSILKNISLIDPSKRFIEGDTLIFFDELQVFPDIATSLKFFAQDGRFDVICSGSLLGISYHQIESNSVGYKTDHIMRSLDFEEFLRAKGYDCSCTEDMLSHMIGLVPFSDTELSVFRSLFLEFSVLGGMPAVISQYITNGTFEGTLGTQRQLLEDYKEDIRKYASGIEQTRIISVFNSIVPQLAKENKKFQYSKVSPGARSRDLQGCIEWLADAGIVNICYCLSAPELPLKGNYDPSRFKLYLADSGLLVAMLDDEAQEDLRANKNLGIYKGALFENIVGEALVKSGADLYYYRRDDSTLEQDFFLRTSDSLVPIEVKAQSGRAKSLRTLITSDRYTDIRFGIKLTGGNIGSADDIYTFPYFCAYLLKRYLRTR